ncbi:GNAT family N-acetyltransferase [Paenibacillus radicis (ex Xue et al. 2023)]|uniref:GNAT family N-acetyltransferase n=1 Tax=Paenibacillus radicis (ex Xue et al. 2023) TaxID=2972489 RepID=A0ABT1YAU4_9BACL|nr:GNAT family N-acetyltransferase [Paenibacillus radicis (ex Xue et al. 2023)]MCR8630306.1 GNAT family N-acetyltransferase [Paenibacillus radicis (ex Xue et al. 2023)]
MIIHVRLATINDADVLSSLNFKFNGGDKRPVTEIVESLKSCNELVAVATLSDEVIGFACAQSFKSFCYKDAYGEITEMYVEEAARRKGVATSLLSFLEEQLSLRGVKTIKVLTGSDNEAAINTYVRSNYIVDDEVMLNKKLK